MWFLHPKSQILPRISHNILNDTVKTQSHDTVYVEKKFFFKTTLLSPDTIYNMRIFSFSNLF
jgi:hypothetical protein